MLKLQKNSGYEFLSSVHDWLGGYLWSISVKNEKFVESLNFKLINALRRRKGRVIRKWL